MAGPVLATFQRVRFLRWNNFLRNPRRFLNYLDSHPLFTEFCSCKYFTGFIELL